MTQKVEKWNVSTHSIFLHHTNDAGPGKNYIYHGKSNSLDSTGSNSAWSIKGPSALSSSYLFSAPSTQYQKWHYVWRRTSSWKNTRQPWCGRVREAEFMLVLFCCTCGVRVFAKCSTLQIPTSQSLQTGDME